jgi:5-methylcytosine-specific restriction endonuclease McrA
MKRKPCKCITCGKITYIFNSQFTIEGRGKWCSLKCRYPQRIKVTCPECGKVKSIPPSIAKMGAKYCSFQCKALAYKKLKRGKNNPAWRGGITKLAHSIRTSDRYISLRLKTIIRDKKTCMECGYHGEELEVHHIKPLWKLIIEFLELKIEFNPEHDFFYDEDNLITLCHECHVNKKV